MIASVSGWSDYRSFDEYASQESSSISPDSGTKILYHSTCKKKKAGGDHLSVAWEGPDSPTRAIITKDWIEPLEEVKPKFTQYEIDKGSISEGTACNGSIAGDIVESGSFKILSDRRAIMDTYRRRRNHKRCSIGSACRDKYVFRISRR